MSWFRIDGFTWSLKDSTTTVRATCSRNDGIVGGVSDKNRAVRGTLKPGGRGTKRVEKEGLRHGRKARAVCQCREFQSITLKTQRICRESGAIVSIQ